MQFVQFTAARADNGAVLPRAKVFVYITGTTTPISLFDQNGSPLPNPVTADETGLVGIAAANGTYDAVVSSADGLYQAPNIIKLQIFDLAAIANALAAGTVAGVIAKIKDTRADLNADLGAADSSLGLVYADPAPANNDLYVKSGASGSGSWIGPIGFLTNPNLRNGIVDPDSTVGVDGDFYINTVSLHIFGPKSGGVWPLGVSMVGTVTGASGQTVSTKPLMSNIVSPVNGQACLLSADGSAWVFSNANFSASGSNLVPQDPAQGLYNPPASDTTGASGAWVRQLGDKMWLNAEWCGLSTAGIGSSNCTAVNRAVTLAKAASLKGVHCPAKDYPFDGPLALGSVTNLQIYARGTRFFGTYPSITSGSAASDVTLIGGHFDETSGGLTTAAFDHSGTRIRMIHTRFTRPNGGDPTYCGYFRSSSFECFWDGVTTLYWNGFFIEGTNHTLANGNHTGIGPTADDCYVFKGALCVSSGHKIVNARVVNYACGVSFGSEAGTGGADDSNFKYGIENIQVLGLTTVGVERPVFVKPGSISTIDYRNGFVRNVLIDGLTINDPTGSGAQELLRFSCDRGSVVELISVKNVKFRGRAAQVSGLTPYGIYFYFTNYGTQQGTIQDVEIEYDHLDAYAGAANGAAVTGYPSGTTTALGYPFKNIAQFDKANNSFGIPARIGIKVNGNGCISYGVRVAAGYDDAVTVRAGTRLMNTCQGDANAAGIASGARLRIEDNVIIANVGNSRHAVGTSVVTGTNLYNCRKELRRFGSFAAGTGTGGSQVPVFVAPRDLYLSDLDLMVSNTPGQSDTNYKTIMFFSNGSNFLTVTTKVTGGVALVANTPLRLNSAVLNTSNAYIAKGSLLTMTIADTGTGVALNDLHVQLSITPYGELS